MNPYANIQPFDHNAIAQRFQQGRQMRQERDTKNALMDYYGAQMGDDPAAKSLMPVLQANPELGGRLLSQHQQQRQQTQQQQRESLLKAAQIFRAAKSQNPGVPDEQIYASVLPTIQQFVPNADKLPQPGDPQLGQYLQSALAAADALAPQKAQGQPTSYEEYQRAQSDPNYAQFLEERRGPLIANNGDGTFTIIPRSMAGGQMGGQQPPPPPPGFVIDQGGPTPPASGGFPVGPR